MKTILITGSNGLTGQKIIYALLDKKDVRCIATSKGENRTKEKAGYVYESLDITNREEVNNIFEKYKPYALINTAAMTNVDACETQQQECMKMNVDAVAYLADACKKLNTHFIHLSTDFVFDGLKGSPYAETDTPNPESFYSKSKYEGELLLQKSSLKWAILRTIIIYGVVDDNKRSNLVLWTKNSLEKKQQINVIMDQYRAPTLAEDLADACVQAALKGATGIYHVSGDETKSILEWVNITADFFHLDKSFINPITTASLKQPARRPPVTGFIIDKAKRDLDFRPHSYLEGLQIVKEQLEKIG
jgi:dTDP-4-dehydrorhamnose reductase